MNRQARKEEKAERRRAKKEVDGRGPQQEEASELPAEDGPRSDQPTG